MKVITCRIIQAITSLIATLAIALICSAYDQSEMAFIISSLVFLVAIIIHLIANLVCDIALHKKELFMDLIEELPDVEEVQRRSAKAVFCNYNKDGFYLY